MIRWDDVKSSIMNSLNEDEKATIEFMTELVSMIIDRMQERKLSLNSLEELTGVKKSELQKIQQFEKIPEMNTIFKIIAPLGLKLTVTKI